MLSGDMEMERWSELHEDSKTVETCVALRDLGPVVKFKNVKNTHGRVLLLVNL